MRREPRAGGKLAARDRRPQCFGERSILRAGTVVDIADQTDEPFLIRFASLDMLRYTGSSPAHASNYGPKGSADLERYALRSTKPSSSARLPPATLAA